jgi:hypothetical protein
MDAKELRALTRQRRGLGGRASKEGPRPAVPDRRWPDIRYDGLYRLRLPPRHEAVALTYRDDFRDAANGDEEAAARLVAARTFVANPDLTRVMDQVLGEGEILWNLVGGDRPRYRAIKGWLAITFAKLRTHYGEDRWRLWRW